MTGRGELQSEADVDDDARPASAPEALGRRARRLVGICVGALLLAPAALALGYIHRFGVDVPFADDYGLVPLLVRREAGTLTAGDLFAQANEHRLFFPQVVMVAVAQWTKWDLRAEMYLTWFFASSLTLVMLAEHVRTFGRNLAALAAFVPIAWTVLTLRQWENLLQGCQLQIPLCTLSAIASFALLQGTEPTRTRFVGSMACATVASFSFAAGIATWPAGALYLAWRTWRARPRGPWARRLLAWLVTMAAVAILYLHGFQTPEGEPDRLFAFEHPVEGASAALTAVGSSLSGGFLPLALAAGAALCGVALLLAWASWRKWLDPEALCFAIPCLAFAAATTTMIILGRAGMHSGATLPSRYTTLTLLGVVSLFRASLALKPALLRRTGTTVMGTLMFLGAFVAIPDAFSNGARVSADRRQGVRVLRDWATSSERELSVLNVDAPIAFDSAPELERLGVSVFRGRLRRIGAPWGDPLRVYDAAQVPRLGRGFNPVTESNTESRWIWAYGPRAEIVVPASSQGPSTVSLEVLDSPAPAQQMTITCGYESFGPLAPPQRGAPLVIECPGRSRATFVELGFARWNGGPDLFAPLEKRPLSVAFSRVAVEQGRHVWELVPQRMRATPAIGKPHRIQMADAESEAFLGSGWAEADADGRRFTIATRASVGFRIDPPGPVRLRAALQTFGPQRVVIRLNDVPVAFLFRNGSEPRELELELPAGAMRRDSVLALELPDATSARSRGVGTDSRRLGVALRWLELGAVELGSVLGPPPHASTPHASTP